MDSGVTGTLDEAYQRLHATGPEFNGWLSNHGPMAAEAMARRGHADRVHPWLDGYMARLEEFPRGRGPIGPGWQEALGDPRRIADWTAHFQREVTAQPWRAVLETWWPRLLPGVAAAATHGVIRVGHAVRALTAIYAPAAPADRTGLPDPPGGPQAAEETFARAVEHGDEHVIKFADTAADVYARTGNPGALAAAIRATRLIGC